MKNNERWQYQLRINDEIWGHSDDYDTREDAIKFGSVESKKEGLKKFQVGKRVDINMYCIDADTVLERIGDIAYDDAGEVAEDYLDDVTKEESEELEERLNEVLSAWITKYGYKPSFYKIEDIETIIV